MRRTILDIQRMKERSERIPMVTCYDYTSAQIIDRADVPMTLVGDTLGMVVLGYSSTVEVTIDDMIHHARAVVRGSSRSLVIGDLPFLSYATVERAITNAGRLIQDGGVQAVKVEGGSKVAPIVQRLVELGIPVMGHIGLTPQSVNQLGGMRVQGKHAGTARRLILDAVALEEAGAFSVVLELVPRQLAEEITRRLRIPTIGIGAGPGCDGQVLVWHDLLGLYTDFVPKHTRVYVPLADLILESLRRYSDEVRDGRFPSAEHSSAMPDQEFDDAVRHMQPEHVS